MKEYRLICLLTYTFEESHIKISVQNYKYLS